ncbi:hypothetical protein GSI_03056 [Ganoderma sinense ZZ0214-1]|uniref:Uncharacterized protein n=1 Tax=Ganoderma sinense ZZ0214-1 TaxID=1077348 RepID=A0A2G8SKJ0_9APHY|nr:hypothetical protein GSI_03056 [Ganoderma sinense ZZ0214-1]
MPLACTGFHHLPSARRSILHAILFGQEVDLYEGIDRILQHLSNIAECDDPSTHGYYCAPQGHVTARSTVKLRDLDQLHDPDYHPSPPQSSTDQGGEEAEEGLEDEVAVDLDEDEQEQVEESLAGNRLGVRGLVEAASQDDNDASSELTSALDRSFATSSSTEIPYKLFRLPDFRLSHAWLRSDDGEERIRYNTALVEVKLCTKQTVLESNNRDMSYMKLLNRAINDMAPQVIEAVQVAFAEKPDQQEIVAIPTVNAFCCFVYFARRTVPPLDPAMANQGKGFQDPRGLTGRKLYETYGKRVTNTVQIISGGGDFFDTTNVAQAGNNRQARGTRKKKVALGKTFVSHWNAFVEWTRNKNLFRHPDEED